MNSTSKSSTSKKIQLQIQRHLKNTSRFNFKFRGCLKNTLRFKFKFENFCRALEDSIEDSLNSKPKASDNFNTQAFEYTEHTKNF